MMQQNAIIFRKFNITEGHSFMFIIDKSILF